MNGRSFRLKFSCRLFEHRYNASKCYNEDGIMNRISKGAISLFSSAALAAFVFAQVPDQEGLVFCSCSDTASFDHELPMSHPINRCATERNTSVSWSAWFSGRSNPGQFHYLDLLELLSRDSERQAEATHTSP